MVESSITIFVGLCCCPCCGKFEEKSWGIPVSPYTVYDCLLSSADVDEDTRLRVITELMHKLPLRNFTALKTLILFLAEVVANSSANLMDANNLAVVFGPNLVWSTDVSTDAVLRTGRRNYLF